MNRITLNDYVARHGQTKTAGLLGLSQGAISKMLRIGRAVFIVEHGDGSIEAVEERRIGKQQGNAA
jgi:predicted transcriptional regulator